MQCSHVESQSFNLMFVPEDILVLLLDREPDFVELAEQIIELCFILFASSADFDQIGFILTDFVLVLAADHHHLVVLHAYLVVLHLTDVGLPH